ncbi:acetyl-CoA carboxylase biotin carboxyl carrier protein subunit [Flexivirga alba]|uniref:Acetyl-CoA carboxylase biotin carboxyl carrier protein subunit n=1 Tax=Flexivirga alba TaxID=702742 RepID=A0ABW2AJM2_9MICO
MAETFQAEVTGQVREVLVAPGDGVSEADPMVVLESMKLPVRVLSTGDGVVVAVHVAEGDTVGPGQPLVDVVIE